MAERQENATLPLQMRSRSPNPVPSPEAPKESAVARLLLAPLAFLSFLLSLALISERNLALRSTSHNAYPNTFLGRFRSILHFLLFKRVDHSPYAYVRSPNATPEVTRRGGGVEVKGREKLGVGKEKEKEPWHWHTNQRHMMKVEMDDAFAVRKWVMLALVAAILIAMVGISYTVQLAIERLRNWVWIGREL